MKDRDKSREELIRELAELRTRCDRQEGILSSLHLCVLLVVSPDRKIQMCSPSVRELFGYAVEEVVGRTTDLLYFDRRSRPDVEGEIYEVLEREGYHVGLATGKKKDGGTLTLEIVTGKIVNSGGAVLLLRDISASRMEQEALKRHCDFLRELVEERNAAVRETQKKLQSEADERIQTEEKIQRFHAELEERVKERTAKLQNDYEEIKALDALKDAFLSSVSHEFRTPLASIRSFAEIMLNYPVEDPQTQREFLTIIQSECERLGRLIDNVLDLSKIRAGKMEWRFHRLKAGSVVRRAVQAMKSLLAKKNLEVVTDIEQGLPEFPGDEDRIHQVLTNLLSNAIKFSPEGGTIRVSAEFLEGRRSADRADFVHLSVRDFGAGIQPEDLPTIFEQFNRGGDTLAEKPKGTGLGLSICREIVSAHKGEIWAESTDGRGSTFHVSLPACTLGDAPAEAVCGDEGVPEHLC